MALHLQFADTKENQTCSLFGKFIGLWPCLQGSTSIIDGVQLTNPFFQSSHQAFSLVCLCYYSMPFVVFLVKKTKSFRFFLPFSASQPS